MNTNELALVVTSGCHLLCFRDEKFLTRLAGYEGDAAAVLQQLSLPHMLVKQGTHCHVPFFANMVRAFAPPSGRWKMLDIGGYIGVIGIPVAKWAAAQGHGNGPLVEIFEPTAMADLIERSAELNGLGALVKVHRLAASNAKGRAIFNNLANQRVAGHLGGPETPSSTMVETIAIDDLYPDLTDALVIAKVDTEGHEPRVLEGMAGLLERNRSVLIVEFHEKSIGSRFMGRGTYEGFLFERFQVFKVGNIGYPWYLQEIPQGDVASLRRALSRDGNCLTDLVCFDRRLPADAVAHIVRPLRKG